MSQKLLLSLDDHDHQQLLLLSRLKKMPMTRLVIGLIQAYLDKEPPPRAPADVDQVLDAYSTPGLRKRELDRYGKKEQLGSLGIKGEQAEKILEQLFQPPAPPAADEPGEEDGNGPAVLHG
jgi:hypothetical protein